jgi:hypothetical protein
MLVQANYTVTAIKNFIMVEELCSKLSTDNISPDNKLRNPPKKSVNGNTCSLTNLKSKPQLLHS